MIQGAAKGIYRHTERLGLNQAFQDAVQGLQSGSSTPRRAITNTRWSLDRGRFVDDQEERLVAQISRLRRRNKDLGKLLQAAMDDLSGQIDQLEESSNVKTDPQALALVVAKLQYVQIYLEDSTLPLGGKSSDREEPSSRSIEAGDEETSRAEDPASQEEEAETSTIHAKPGSEPSDLPLRRRLPERASQSASAPSPSRRPKTKTSEDSKGRTDSPLRTSLQQSRPSLAESSFSWMLGASPPNAHFGSSTPFSPEQERKATARGKNGYLFGDAHSATGDPKATKSQAQQEDSEGFTLGTLKGAPRGL